MTCRERCRVGCCVIYCMTCRERCRVGCCVIYCMTCRERDVGLGFVWYEKETLLGKGFSSDTDMQNCPS